MWWRPHGCSVAFLPAGIPALPGSSPPRLAAGSSGLCGPTPRPRHLAARWQREDERGVHLPTAACSPLSRGVPPPALSWAATEIPFAAWSLRTFPRFLRPSPAAARSGLGPAASGLGPRASRPLKPQRFPARAARGGGSPRPGCQGCRRRGGVWGGLEIARSPALRSPPPSPSDLAGHGQPRLLSLSLSLRAGGALRQWGKGVGCANSGRRDAPVHAASPQPPLPSACLPLWSLGLMN